MRRCEGIPIVIVANKVRFSELDVGACVIVLVYVSVRVRVCA